MPTIFDNIENQFLEGLSRDLDNAKRVDYCVGYFNLRGWGLVCDRIDLLAGAEVQEKEETIARRCRLLVGMTKTPREELKDEFADPVDLLVDNKKASRFRKQLAQDFAEQLTFGVPRNPDEKNLKKLLSQLKDGKVAVRLFLSHRLHAKLYVSHSDDKRTPVAGLLGSSNFTLSGLSKQGELNIDVLDQDAATKLSKWFDDRWNDRWCIDVTRELIEVLENSWARPDQIPPYHIYLKMAYHLSREARAGLAEFKPAKDIAKELLLFQEKAVSIAAHHVHHRRGVVIGDVVGLGKTLVATAVARILEDDFSYNTLIVCPKNLVEMWRGYCEKYGLRTPRIVSHSMVHKELRELRRYRLVIVDESHNFRNNLTQSYSHLRDYIQENDSKVILLSATPYNKSYIDLANQLQLFLPDDFDLGMVPERYIESLGGMVSYKRQHPDTNERTIRAFEKSNFPDDWRDVMKLYMVRRTRSFVKANYSSVDEVNGRKYIVFSNGDRSYFPDRLPKRVGFALDGKDSSDQYARLYDAKIVDAINSLNLPRYGLQQYLDKDSQTKRTKKIDTTIANLSRGGRRVLGFCRTNLFKRLESSGYAFLLSLSRHILRNYITLHALSNGLDLPVSGQSVTVDMYSDDEDDGDGLNMGFDLGEQDYIREAEAQYATFSTAMKERFEWLPCGLFDSKRLVGEIEADNKKLLSILSKVKRWDPGADRKLDALYRLLSETHKSEKVIVFTQYADTAYYLHQELGRRGLDGLEVAVGGSENIVGLVHRFSPISNECKWLAKSDEIRVLVSTDVMSEGQNLQDAHIVVNFDLPWALVRLVQRAGRVDRLGQKSPEILCYSFLPEEGLEHIIGLRKKLSNRITENAEVVGSDETFFEGDPINLADLYTEKSGIFDEMEDHEVDLASQAYQIWKNAIDNDPSLKAIIEKMPNVVFSAKDTGKLGPDRENSVIVYAQTIEQNDALVWLDADGEVITQSQHTILKAAECAPDTPAEPKGDGHHALVECAVKLIQSENHSVSGMLGRPRSVKHRTFARLERLFEENPQGSLFIPANLKKALDQIINFPMKESAIEAISRQFKANVTDEDLANLVASRYELGTLCVVRDEDAEKSLAQVICSMGIVGGQG